MSPKEMGELADHWWSVYNQRLDADKAAARLKAQETEAKEKLIAEMILQEITSIGGSKVRLALESEVIPSVAKDKWDLFWAYIRENDAFDLLEKRPGKLACKARWEQGVDIPGVEKFRVYKLSRSEVR
jgi:hypothetical protein